MVNLGRVRKARRHTVIGSRPGQPCESRIQLCPRSGELGQTNLKVLVLETPRRFAQAFGDHGSVIADVTDPHSSGVGRYSLCRLRIPVSMPGRAATRDCFKPGARSGSATKQFKVFDDALSPSGALRRMP